MKDNGFTVLCWGGMGEKGLRGREYIHIYITEELGEKAVIPLKEKELM